MNIATTRPGVKRFSPVISEIGSENYAKFASAIEKTTECPAKGTLKRFGRNTFFGPIAPISCGYERDLGNLLLPPLDRCTGWQLTHSAGNVPICQSQPADTFQRVHLVRNACAVQTVGQRVLAV